MCISLSRLAPLVVLLALAVGCRGGIWAGASDRLHQSGAAAVLTAFVRACEQRDWPALELLFTAECRTTCRGFVPLPQTAAVTPVQLARWTPRLEDGGLLVDLAHVLLSYRRVEGELVPLASRVYDGRILLRALLAFAGPDREEQRRLDRGLVDLELRAEPGGWRIDRFAPVRMITLRREEPLYGRPSALPGSATGETRVWQAGDLDGDGPIDLVTAQGREVLLYRRHAREPRFERPRRLLAAPGPVRALALGDANGDGRPDLFVGAERGTSQLWLNQPEGWRIQPTFQVSGEVRAALFADFDGDHALDLVVVRRGAASLLFVQRSGALVKRAELNPGGEGRAVCAGDLDGNGRLDLFLAEERGPSRLYFNEGGGQLREQPGLIDPLPTTSCAFGDVNGDGKLDVLVAGPRASALWLNETDQLSEQPRPRFRRAVLDDPRPAAWAGLLDGDSDGRLDLLLLPLRGGPRLYVECQGTYLDAAAAAGLEGLGWRSAAALDLGGEGRPALLLDGAAGPRLSDPAPGHHAIVLQLRGKVPNEQAIGARVELLAEGRWQLRVAGLASGLPGGAQGHVHFGLGEALRADEVRVRWPDGSAQRFVDLPVDREVTLSEGGHAEWRSPEEEPASVASQSASAASQSASVASQSAPAASQLASAPVSPIPAAPLELTVQGARGEAPLARYAGTRATVLLVVGEPSSSLAGFCARLTRLLPRRSGVRAAVVTLNAARLRCGLSVLRATAATREVLAAARPLLPVLLLLDAQGTIRAAQSGLPTLLELKALLALVRR